MLLNAAYDKRNMVCPFGSSMSWTEVEAAAGNACELGLNTNMT